MSSVRTTGPQAPFRLTPARKRPTLVRPASGRLTAATLPRRRSSSGGPSRSGRGSHPIVWMWQRAFFRALEELQVEAVKAKLKKASGPMIDKMAGDVVQLMTEEWAGYHRQQGAREKLRAKVRETFEKAK